MPDSIPPLSHPYYAQTIAEARHLGAMLASPVACDPSPPPVTDERALAAIRRERRGCGFNWITGRVAEKLLLTQITGRPHFTT